MKKTKLGVGGTKEKPPAKLLGIYGPATDEEIDGLADVLERVLVRTIARCFTDPSFVQAVRLVQSFQ